MTQMSEGERKFHERYVNMMARHGVQVKLGPDGRPLPPGQVNPVRTGNRFGPAPGFAVPTR